MSTTLPKALKQPNLPSPLLLVGAELCHAIELSKRHFGPEHAAKIDSGNHPDFHLIEPEGKSHLHTISSIHKIIEEMGLPPFETTSKIFVISQAERMLPAAANALLKTLEEPNPDSFFILLSDHPDKLLPTVLSRLTPVVFPRKELTAFDIAPYITLAENRQWDLLLSSLDELEGEDPDSIFKSFLNICAEKGDPDLFFALSRRISAAKRALEHHIKPRAVILHLLMEW